MDAGVLRPFFGFVGLPQSVQYSMHAHTTASVKHENGRAMPSAGADQIPHLLFTTSLSAPSKHESTRAQSTARFFRLCVVHVKIRRRSR